MNPDITQKKEKNNEKGSRNHAWIQEKRKKKSENFAHHFGKCFYQDSPKNHKPPEAAAESCPHLMQQPHHQTPEQVKTVQNLKKTTDKQGPIAENTLQISLSLMKMCSSE